MGPKYTNIDQQQSLMIPPILALPRFHLELPQYLALDMVELVDTTYRNEIF
jgi:hypothetical protein